VDRWLAAGFALSVVAGVVLPLWMATDPAIGRTRLAFAAACWPALILMTSAWTVARRINPVALATRKCDRAIQLLVFGRPDPSGEDPRLHAAHSALAELVGSRALPNAQLRPAVVAYAAFLAIRNRAGDDPAEVEAQIRSLADIASRTNPLTPSGGGRQHDEPDPARVPASGAGRRPESRLGQPESAGDGEPTSLDALNAVIRGGDVKSLEVADAFAALRRMPYKPDEEELSRRSHRPAANSGRAASPPRVITAMARTIWLRH
jgi:hypothetical protein